MALQTDDPWLRTQMAEWPWNAMPRDLYFSTSLGTECFVALIKLMGLWDMFRNLLWIVARLYCLSIWGLWRIDVLAVFVIPLTPWADREGPITLSTCTKAGIARTSAKRHDSWYERTLFLQVSRWAGYEDIQTAERFKLVYKTMMRHNAKPLNFIFLSTLYRAF